MRNLSVQSATSATLLRIPQSSDFEILLHHRRRRGVRSKQGIILAILEACRTPTVQHWVMVKARLGYDTFWKHMNQLVTLGMMNTLNDGNKTLYSINERGLELLQLLNSSEKECRQAEAILAQFDALQA